MKQLIVAADDFGLTKSVNEGIVRAHREGIVTSLNLLPTGEAFDDALRLANDVTLDEAGAHLALTETKAIIDPAKIPTLVDTDGNFYKGHAQFFLKLISGGIDLGQVYIEWKAQLEKARATGIAITNLSTHEHIHMVPALLDIVIRLAKEYTIPAVRYPHADRSFRPLTIKTLYKKAALSCLEKRMGKVLRSSSLIMPDHFLGFLDSGTITEAVLLSIIDSLDEGVTELVCHPGFLGPETLTKHTFHKNCEAELFALTSRRVKKRAGEKCIGLIGYAEFIQNHKDR